MRKNRIFYGIIVILLFWVMIMYNAWQTELLFLISTLVPLIIGGLTFLFRCFLKVYFDEQEEYCQKDDSIKKYIMLDNNTIFPFARIELQVEIEDYFGNKEDRKILLNSEPKTVRNFGMDMKFNHYGIMSLRVKKMVVYDTFLLFKFKKKVNIETMIYIVPDFGNRLSFVFPKYGFEEDEEEAGSNIYGQVKGEVLEVDEYHEGDDIRNIHWKLSSKSDDYVIKHYSTADEEKIHIHVDAIVNENVRYLSCDRILGSLSELVNGCEAKGLDYEILAYGKDRKFETDITQILHGIEVGQENWEFLLELKKKQHSGVHIYLTANKNAEKDMPDDMQHIIISGQEEKKKKEYHLEKASLIQIDVSEKEQECNDKFFIEPYNDKIRPHKKIHFTEQNVLYAFTMSVIAVLATQMAVCSIADVLFLYQQVITKALIVVFFVIVHFIIDMFCMGIEEHKKQVRLKNAITLLGYIVIILLGGVTFIFDGISEIIQIFGMDITISTTDYGFLEYTNADINWLIILAAYAITDVIYNFSQEFLLPVHLVIVIPLVCISMIVGYVPPTYIVIIASFYFSVVFAVNTCLTMGKKKTKKYLSDDYPYTSEVTVKTSVMVAVVTLMVMCTTALYLNIGGYEKASWMLRWKNQIDKAVEAESLQEGLLKLSQLFGTEEVRTSGERGQLDDTKRVYYMNETILEITLRSPNRYLTNSFFLKSYTGSDYSGNSWKSRSEEELEQEEQYMNQVLGEENLSKYNELNQMNIWHTLYGFRYHTVVESIPYNYAICQSNGSYIMSSVMAKSYTMMVKSLLNNDKNVYKPYFSVTMGGNIEGADGYEYFTENDKTQSVVFHGLDLGGKVLNTGNIGNEYGEFPYMTSTADTDEILLLTKEAEEAYADFVEQNYLDVPKNLEDFVQQFQNVSTIYRGQMLTLQSGDKQYQTVGYEPYIQYVRRYFDENGYSYHLNAVRKDEEKDFIKEFVKRKKGYCIHFASTAVMMFRAMGIPARYAEGYYVMESDITDNREHGIFEYEVKDRNAHAWVEIYERGIGWVPIEVTPGAERFEITEEELFTDLTTASTTESEDTESSEQETNETESVKENIDTTVETTQSQESTDTGAAQNATHGEMSVQTKKFLHRMFFVLAIVVLFLFRYQFLCNRNRKRIHGRAREDAIKEMNRQFTASVKLFEIDLTETQTNKEKAEKLYWSVKQPEVEVGQLEHVWNILDKWKYAPAGSITTKDTKELYAVLLLYQTCIYRQAPIHKKFIYKYIKCLYLKDK